MLIKEGVILKELGEYFRTTRTNNGVSLEEASEDLNLSISQLENIEEGVRRLGEVLTEML